MIHERIIISEKRSAYLDTYFNENYEEFHHSLRRPLIIVCPGGGYSYLSDREGEPIALRFMAAGFNAMVLYYGIGEHAVAPGPLRDIAAAVALARKNADTYHIDPNQIYVCGFSAGGHVAATLGVYWNSDDILPEYSGLHEDIRPNGMILGYPVINLKASSTHLDMGLTTDTDLESYQFSQKHPKMPLEKMFVFDEKEGRPFVDFEQAMNAYIFDGEFTDEQEEVYCLQHHVSADTPPAFIWHDAGDGLIYPSNSLDFASALLRCGVDAELHIFREGGHGIALGTHVTENDPCQVHAPAMHWIDMAIDWVNDKSDFVAACDRA